MGRIRMHRGRARRRRLRSDPRGQVAAIATLFGLLIVVSLISELAIAPLPTEEQNSELQHLFQVEDQFGQLQADLMLEAHNPHFRTTISAPITLGSAPVPPFGSASSSELALLPTGASTRLTAETIRSGPNWGTGSLCSSPDGSTSTSGGTTTCTFTANGCSGAQTWNVSLSSATYVFDLKGNSGSCQIINVTGNSNTITIIQTANNMGSFNFSLYGSHNTITVEWQGKTSAAMQFYIYGSNNTYEYGSGGSFNGNSVGIVTHFIGEAVPPGTGGCPVDNLASYDKVGPLKTSGSGDTQGLYFYNSNGINNGPTTVTPSGSPTLTWQNISETPSTSKCAFGGTGPSGKFYPFLFGGGSLSANLENRYTGAVTLSMEGGAILAGQSSGAVLVDPPAFNFSSNATANSARLTFFNFVETSSRTASGYSTAAIVTQLLSETVFQATFPLTVNGVQEYVIPTLNVTTSYPSAWLAYFNGLAPDLLNGTVSCYSATPIASPYSCYHPPAGAYVSLTLPLNVSSLLVTVATIQISVA
jgi:hypothetical protein